MSGRGPAPKDAGKRRRRNATPAGRELTGDGRARGPRLPDLPDTEWPEQTRRWWETWRRSAQAQTFTGTDWDFLLDTALLHAQLWSGNGSVAAELRLRVAKFGATPEDRSRLRLSVDDPPAGIPPGDTAAEGGSARYGHLRSLPPE